MELTQKDYDERIARRGTDEYTDEDDRLIRLYEREGFSSPTKGGPVSGSVPSEDKTVDDDELEPGKYDGLTQREASAQAKERGLTATGTRDEIVARLEKADRDSTGA